MKITKIEEQKNKKRLNIYVDGEYHSSVDKDILEEMSFYEGMDLNLDEFNQKLETIQYKSALRAALYMLTHSSKTENEIEKKLKEKQHSDNAIRKVLEYLKGIGYINDESYTESFIRSMSDVTGTSSRNLYYKLVSKGVDKDIIERKLEESEIDDYASALKAAEKKVAGLKGDKREKVSKLLNFLYRKGFGMEVCRRVLAALDLEES
jgi:regulatory protein